MRADALRNVDTLLAAAAKVFARSGVDAPAREIAVEAGVGVGTLYRHFPNRSDLVVAVFRHEIDACAAEAAVIAARHPTDPVEALRLWLHRYVEFNLAKRRLVPALSARGTTLVGLHEYFDQRLGPPVRSLLDTAIQAGTIGTELTPHMLLHMVRVLCIPDDDGTVTHVRPAVDLLIDGLQYRAR